MIYMKYDIEVYEIQPHILSFQAITNNKVIGTTMLEGDWIYDVEVDAAYRNLGIATALVQKAIEYGGKELAVEDGNEIAYNLYLKLGFAPHSLIEDEGILYTVMWRG